MMLSFAMPSQTLYNALYSGNNKAVFSTLLTLLLQSTSLTGTIRASLPPWIKTKVKKRAATDYFGNSFSIRAMLNLALSSFIAGFLTGLFSYLLIALLPSSAETVPSPSRLVYGIRFSHPEFPTNNVGLLLLSCRAFGSATEPQSSKIRS